MHAFFFSALLISNAYSAIVPQEQLLPLPNTIYTQRCALGQSVTTTGSLLPQKKTSSMQKPTYKMNMNVKTTYGDIRATIEPWSRFIMLYSAADGVEGSRETKIFSGNLEDFNLIVGSKYKGHVTQKWDYNGKNGTDEWDVELKVASTLKVLFKDQPYDAFKILLKRNKLNGDRVSGTAEILYIPKIQMHLHLKIINSNSKNPYECTLLDFKPIANSTSPTAKPEPVKASELKKSK